ncbi:enoyl-CoA hydratase/isomerase family protein [Castellaniella sp.]|uniref:enoyl-CoA hydratase/isomerase family protein n=1 Tax=Castellaniella sp. TaxID=1955812 RepID=UPI003C777E5A
MDTLLLQQRPAPGVLLLILNRPDKRNALNQALVRALDEALATAAADEDVACVVLTGDQRAFSAGADIHDQHAHGADVALSGERLAAWQRIADFEKPYIAAVNGYCLGGGNELAMMTDFIIAGENAIFGQPEINLGIFPGDGGTQRLPRLIGAKNAARMILTGERVSAERAWRMGLVSEVVANDDTVTHAVRLAAGIAGKSRQAARLAKATIRDGLDLTLADGLKLEHDNLRPLFGTDAQKDNMARFAAGERSHSGGEPARHRTSASA